MLVYKSSFRSGFYAELEIISICSFLSFGQVPGVSVLMYADVSELSIGSIF